MTTRRTRWPLIAVGAVIGVLMAAASLVSGAGTAQALVVGVIPLAYALLVTALAPRSEMASVLAGAPVDERFELINVKAGSIAFGASAVFALGGLLLTQATGGDWLPWALLCKLMAGAYLGALLLLRVRG